MPLIINKSVGDEFMTKKKLFGTNGIRGYLDNDLSIEFLIDITFSIGLFLTKAQ